VPALQDSLEPADDVAHLTEAYVRVRYAELESSRADTEAVREQLERLRMSKSSDQAQIS
jgi:hypothetical protein